jgi:hypothetical protein
VELILAQRGIVVSYETVRRWCKRFGATFAGRLRRRRPRLIGYLQQLPSGVRPHEVILRAAAGRGESALPLRLIVQRKTPEATEATRLALRRAAIKKGKKLDPRSLIAAEFMILATSLPQTGYTAKDVLAVYRCRWRPESAYKRRRAKYWHRICRNSTRAKGLDG